MNKEQAHEQGFNEQARQIKTIGEISAVLSRMGHTQDLMNRHREAELEEQERWQDDAMLLQKLLEDFKSGEIPGQSTAI